MVIQFFFFIAMIRLISMQQDLFVWQQLNVAAGLDFFFFFWGGGEQIVCVVSMVELFGSQRTRLASIDICVCGGMAGRDWCM